MTRGDQKAPYLLPKLLNDTPKPLLVVCPNQEKPADSLASVSIINLGCRGRGPDPGLGVSICGFGEWDSDTALLTSVEEGAENCRASAAAV